MDAREIRELFLSFFVERDHVRVPSASLIPPPESGLLLTNAGMNQFIPYFLGQAEPPFRRATSCQKCFRTVDIDNVGHTDRHLTLFEMLGNFSFGDYFKRESCAWGLELVTEGYGIDPELLWVTIFETDDEAEEIWRDLGIAPDRIVRRDKSENYWSTHAAGPGGPSSEIYVDRGAKYGPDGGPAVDEERFMEIWNHVFMQDEVDAEENVLRELPAKNIDTGSSLERVAVVLQGVDNVFETDLLRPVLEVVESLSGTRHGADPEKDVSLKIVAEHGRATTFLIADGVFPSNEGRGYVLRRMLRRMVTHARRLGVEEAFTQRLVDATVETLGDAYPELVENRSLVLQVAGSEEERFASTLKQGLGYFERPGSDRAARFSGDDAFKLHDTYGFPRELTEELASEAGLDVDWNRFDELMTAQRQRARSAMKRGEGGPDTSAIPPTEFVGYEHLATDARILGVFEKGEEEREVASEGDRVQLFLDRTPFYAESGGQVADTGTIRTAGGIVRVEDAQWTPQRAIALTGIVESGEVREGEEAHAEVDAERRAATARSHTATHVVHWTMRHLLGDHARQAGSLVAPGRLRFDFPNPSGVPRERLEEAEILANSRLAEDDTVRIFETTMDEAKRLGAIALFEEKYGDFVRVVEIGDYSRELCGGTHVPHTGRVAVVRILGEQSIGSGMRRIEALVGPDAIREINLERKLLEDVTAALGGGDVSAAPERARKAVEQLKRLESELGKLRKAERGTLVESLAADAVSVDGASLVVSEVSGEDAAGLRELAQALRGRLESSGAAAAVLGNADGGKALLVAAVTAPLVDRGVTAQALLERAASEIGGGAGGKPLLGFAGGRNAAALPQALGGIPARLAELLAV
ncbi:MAG: alanine--tRNA ligase [Actinomycetota bacterium]